MNYVIYNRVSTEEQGENGVSLQAMESACRAFIVSQGGQLIKIYTDVKSGGDLNRPHLQELLQDIKNNAIPIDTILVWRLDRLGRSMKHLIEMITQLEEKGIGFRSLTEAMDTTTSGGKLIFHIFGALAEFERNLIQERTQAGLAAARARGRKGGRPYALEESKRKMAIELYNSKEHSVDEICQTMGISRPTLYNYLRAAKSQ